MASDSRRILTPSHQIRTIQSILYAQQDAKLRGDTSPHAIRRQSRYPQAKRLGIGPPYGTAEIHHKALATMRQPEVLPGKWARSWLFMALTRFAAAAGFGETTGRFPSARRSSRNNPAILRDLQRRRSPRIFCTQSLAGSPLCFFTMRSPAYQTHSRLLRVPIRSGRAWSRFKRSRTAIACA